MKEVIGMQGYEVGERSIAIPPGATIREQLEDRGMTQREFALRMETPEEHISQLLDGKVELTPDVSTRLESVLGLPVNFWHRLDAAYLEDLARVRAERGQTEEDKLVICDRVIRK
jgi:HTH-type transcriptional regulator/antitoxin HigA